MSEQQQPKEVLLIYLVSVIHWFGFYTLMGLLYVLFNLSLAIIIPLMIIGLFILPPIFRIVKKGEEDQSE